LQRGAWPISSTIIPTRSSRRLLGQRRVDFGKVDVGIRELIELVRQDVVHDIGDDFDHQAIIEPRRT